MIAAIAKKQPISGQAAILANFRVRLAAIPSSEEKAAECGLDQMSAAAFYVKIPLPGLTNAVAEVTWGEQDASSGHGRSFRSPVEKVSGANGNSANFRVRFGTAISIAQRGGPCKEAGSNQKLMCGFGERLVRTSKEHQVCP